MSFTKKLRVGLAAGAQLGQIQFYPITYAAVALLIAFWVLPGLVSALTLIPYSEVLGPVRAALIAAFMAGDLFIWRIPLPAGMSGGEHSWTPGLNSSTITAPSTPCTDTGYLGRNPKSAGRAGQ